MRAGVLPCPGNLAKTLCLAALASLAAGCGGSSEAVTDPNKLGPVTAEEKQEVRKADDALAAEESANPKEPRKVKVAAPSRR